MVRLTIGFTALLASAALAAGCASVDASTEKSAAAKPATTAQQADEIEVGYITGSRLPRKATQNTQGVKQAAPQDWRNYQPPAPLKGD